MKQVILEVNNVNKTYQLGDEIIHVLKDVDLSIEKGEFISIMGPSGSGKSTLLYLMGGLDRVSSGEIRLNGRDISCLGDDEESGMRRREIGFVFQSYNLIENLTVEENILLPVLLDGKPRKAAVSEAEALMKAVGLLDRRNHTPRELSGGQQQRTAIARALVNKPDILFADEPIGNLDSKTGTEILELLKKINLEYGVTVLMVTHSEESAGYGNRIIRLRDGIIGG